MNGPLTALCGHYYNLKMKLNKRDDRFKTLFENVLRFDRNVKVSELDAILQNNRKIIEAFDKADITYEKYKETEREILQILKNLGVRENWFLTGEIPGVMEYEIWHNDNKVYIIKIQDLQPEPESTTTINIRMVGFDDKIKKEDDEDDDD